MTHAHEACRACLEMKELHVRRIYLEAVFKTLSFTQSIPERSNQARLLHPCAPRKWRHAGGTNEVHTSNESCLLSCPLTSTFGHGPPMARIIRVARLGCMFLPDYFPPNTSGPVSRNAGQSLCRQLVEWTSWRPFCRAFASSRSCKRLAGAWDVYAISPQISPVSD